LEYGLVSGVDSVRLTESQEETIVREVASLLGEDASVWLFGSRARDSARGGDIDLYAEVSKPVPQRLKAKLVVRLEKVLSNHVALVIREPGMPESPIFSIARQTGVALGPYSRYRRIAKARLLSRLESQNAMGKPLGRRDELYDDHS
jgi:predicted nucleotidyltransferase